MKLFFKDCPGQGRTLDLLVFVYFLSLKQHLRPLVYCVPLPRCNFSSLQVEWEEDVLLLPDVVVEVEVDDPGKLFQGLDVHLLLQEAPLVDQEGQLPWQLVAEIKMALGSFRQVISWNVQLHFTFKPKKASKFFSHSLTMTISALKIPGLQVQCIRCIKDLANMVKVP